MKLLSLQAKNVLLFNDVKFDFDREGLTVIHGINRNSKTLRDTNRSGKSAFFGLLPEVLFDEPINGNRKDRNASGSISIKLQQGPNVFDIVCSTPKGGKTPKYKLFRNGEDLEIRKKEDLKIFIQKITRRNAEQFKIIDYIDNRIPSNVRVGDTTQRREFFTQFFNLWLLDAMRKSITRRLDDVKTTEAVVEEVSAQWSRKSRELKEVKKTLSEKYSEEIILNGQTKLTAINKTIRKAVSETPALANNPECVEQLKWLRSQKNTESINDLINRERQMIRVESSYRQWAMAFDKMTKLKLSPKKIKRLLAENEEVKTKRSEVDYEISALKKQVKSLQNDVHPDTCPTCGQDWADDNGEHVQLEISKNQKKIKSLIASLSDLEVELPLSEEKLLDLLSNYSNEDALAFVEEVGEEYTTDQFESDLKKASKYLKRYNSVKSALVTLGFDMKEALNWSEDELQNHVTSSTSIDVEALDKKAKKIEDYLAEHRVLKSKRDGLSQECDEFLNRLGELKAKIGNKDSLQLLSQAYASNSKTGIKTSVLRNIVVKLEDTLNHYASVIFPERYVFSFDLESSTSFNIVVTRYDAKTETMLKSDVRKLSGAEAGMFDILLSVALRSFLPKKARSNVLILDEVNANFGPEIQDSFQRLIKLLNTEIPHIVLITPRPDDRYEGAQYFTMVRQGNTSKLISNERLK